MKFANIVGVSRSLMLRFPKLESFEEGSVSLSLCAATMAENMEQILKPFHRRAAEAEERLAKLEALLASKKGDVDTESSASTIKELQSKLETAQSELQSEREKTSMEIQKLEYRILLLVRALREADSKLAASAVK